MSKKDYIVQFDLKKCNSIVKNLRLIGHPIKMNTNKKQTLYAIRCLEKQDDGTWLPKILCKGPTVFDSFFTWEYSQYETKELLQLEGKDSSSIIDFVGGDLAPCFRVCAEKNNKFIGGVKYTVFTSTKLMELTSDLIDLLSQSYKPSDEEGELIRKEYDQEHVDSLPMGLPDWRDYFTYGFKLDPFANYVI